MGAPVRPPPEKAAGIDARVSICNRQAVGSKSERRQVRVKKNERGGRAKCTTAAGAVCVMRVMPRANYPIIVCLLGLGLAVLPPKSGDDQAVAVAAVTDGHTAATSGTINAPAIAPVVVNTPSSEDQPRATLQQNQPIPR